VAKIVITIEDQASKDTGADVKAEFDGDGVPDDRAVLTYAQHLAFVALTAIAEHDETPPPEGEMN
jgi:hypothetical protein